MCWLPIAERERLPELQPSMYCITGLRACVRQRQPQSASAPAQLTEGADSRGVRRAARGRRTGHRGGEGEALEGPAGKGGAEREDRGGGGGGGRG